MNHYLTDLGTCCNGVLIWGIGLFTGVPTLQVIGACVGIVGAAVSISREVREWRKTLKDKK